MRKLTALCLFAALISCYGCNATTPPLTENLKTQTIIVNPAHLDFLCQNVKLPNGKDSVLVHIYCDYPYDKWTEAPGEGISCIDDVARAGIFYASYYQTTGNEEYLDRLKRMTEFILYLHAENGYFYNFVYEDLSINKYGVTSKAEANWWTWRAMCFLGYIYPMMEQKDAALAERIKASLKITVATVKKDIKLEGNVEEVNGIKVASWLPDHAADQSALILMALSFYHKNVEKDSSVEPMMARIADGLVVMQIDDKNAETYGALLCWENIWHGWGNNQAYALLMAGKELKNDKYTKAALLEINHFHKYLMSVDYLKEFSLKKEKAVVSFIDSKKYEQIAYAMRPMILACLEAYNQTGDKEYANQAVELAKWFFGSNPAKVQMYDQKTGIMFDGIDGTDKYNKNSGAESTIECLISLQAIEICPPAAAELQKYLQSKEIK